MTCSSAKPVSNWLNNKLQDPAIAKQEPQPLSNSMLQYKATLALSDMLIIRVSGDKAEEFLQGQLSCDIKLVNDSTCLPAAYCDHRGRMLANFFIYKKNADYFILINNSLSNATLTNLKKYAQFSKVICTVESLKVLFICGDGWQQSFFGKQSPAKTKTFPSGTVHNIKSMSIINNSGKFAWCIAEKNVLKEYWEQKIDNNTWHQANHQMQYATTIQHNLPLLSTKTSLLWTPAMIDWTRHDGVSFSKGCFAGQEIIARTHNLGKEKRHLYKIKIQKNNENKQIFSGSDITCADKKVMGKVVNHSTIGNTTTCLAVIEDRAIKISLYCEKNSIKSLERCGE